MSETNVVVLLSGDLIFASRVRGAAQNAGLEFVIAGNLPQRSDIQWVIVDLATRGGAVDGLMEACQQHCPDAKVLAFGPHVQVAKLEKAKAAGIPHVISRGQFDRALGTLFVNEETKGTD